MTLIKAKQKAFDKCNQIGEECDVYSVLYQFKAIRNLPENEIDAIYDEIVERLGF